MWMLQLHGTSERWGSMPFSPLPKIQTSESHASSLIWVVPVLLLLAGCASSSGQGKPWPAEWNARIGNIELHPSRIAPEAWKGASGVDVSTASGWATQSYIMSRGDNVVGLVGGVITHSIAKGQQNDFESKNADVLSSLEGFFGADWKQALDTSIRASANQTSFRNRMSPPYQSHLYADIESCGFLRAGVDASDEVLLTPAVDLKITLINVNPARVYLHKRIRIDAGRTQKHSARGYATDAAVREAARRALLDLIEAELTAEFKSKLGE